jgi:Tfp pilus assembly protein PilX
MKHQKFTHGSARYTRGVSLIIVLIMLVIIGITAGTAMRTATSEQRATNNLRMETIALQYAEAALRYCESEMAKASGSRVSTLQDAQLYSSTGPGPTTAGWEDSATWTGTSGRSSASRTTVPDSVLQDSTDTVLPTKRPECVVEKMTGYGTVITARGYSPDYTSHATTFETTGGAVVWLQSFI